ELVETAPEKTLLIVFGDLRGLHQVEDTLPEGLAGFWEKNGAILVASDRAEGAHFLANVFGVSPDGEILTAANVKKAYLGELKCPYVTELDSHRLRKGVSRLATNTPTFLRGRSGKYPHLAWFPKGTSGSPLVFAAGNRGEDGRFLLLDGLGVFMNSMMAN